MKTLVQKGFREQERFQRNLMREHRRSRIPCWTRTPELPGRILSYRAWRHLKLRSRYNARHLLHCPAPANLRLTRFFQRPRVRAQ